MKKLWVIVLSLKNLSHFKGQVVRIDPNYTVGVNTPVSEQPLLVMKRQASVKWLCYWSLLWGEICSMCRGCCSSVVKNLLTWFSRIACIFLWLGAILVGSLQLTHGSATLIFLLAFLQLLTFLQVLSQVVISCWESLWSCLLFPRGWVSPWQRAGHTSKGKTGL